MRSYTQRLLLLVLLLASSGAYSASNSSARLFGYQELHRADLELFPQWLSVLERHLQDMTPEGNCRSARFNRCHLQEWQSYLRTLQALPKQLIINRINEYANRKKYVLDIENYNLEDYWATPKEFLIFNGDCEDFAIIKMLSLKKLGFDPDTMRIVVVQDTNLRIPHAVMSIKTGDDVLILDNQIQQVISHRHIFHYVPVYSLNETSWWMHLPE